MYEEFLIKLSRIQELLSGTSTKKGKQCHLLGILKSHLEPTKYNQCQKRVKKYITVSHTKLPSVPTHLSPSWEVRTDGGRGFPFLLRMLLTALCSLGFFASSLLLLCWHPGLTATSRLHVKGGGHSYLTYQQLGTLSIIFSSLMILLHLASRTSHSWLSANLMVAPIHPLFLVATLLPDSWCWNDSVDSVSSLTTLTPLVIPYSLILYGWYVMQKTPKFWSFSRILDL